MKRAIKARMPQWLKTLAKRVRYRVLYSSGTSRHCPICDRSSSRFLPAGVVRRADATCPHCNSLERHRFVWVFVNEQTDLLRDPAKRMLHVAPEACLEAQFRRYLGTQYITADLNDRRTMVKMDVTDIHFPDQSFDVIYCSHVLEHVSDDRQAMREFYRILKPDGWAMLLVPISAYKTHEDPSIVKPSERLIAFGQEDHVRRYGPDFVDRLRDAHFCVDVISPNDLTQFCGRALPHEKFGLTSGAGEIFFCTKARD